MGKYLGRLIILILFAGSVQGQNKYYFSNSGNNNNAGSQASPWQTLDKLNSVFLNQGDSVLLNGGQDFFAPLNINQSGAPGNPIVFASYGTGKARITGMANLTSWSNEGSNIWSAPLNAGGYENVVAMYGNQVAPGRTPNTGWQTISSYTGNNPITFTTNIPSSPDFTGGNLVYKVYDWIINNGRITAHNGSQITAYNPKYAPSFQSGYGAFVQHHPSTLDVQNEWYYDSINARLKVYSTTSPAAFGVRAATVNNVINLTNNYISFNNIIFEGSKETIVELNIGRQGISFKDCEFYYGGLNGLNSLYGTNIIVENCKFRWINNNGCVVILATNPYIVDNNVSQVGMIIGSGVGDNQSCEGMFIDGTNSIVKGNRVDSVGYNGISWSGNNVLLEYNFVSNFTLNSTDGAGFYIGDYKPADLNRVVRNNIALFGRGERSGTPYQQNNPADYNGGSAAFYVDEHAANILFEGNTAGYVNGYGGYVHKGHILKYKNNMFYNNYEQFSVSQDFDPYTDGNGNYIVQNVRNLVATGNTFFAKTARQYIYYLRTPLSDPSALYFDTLNYNVLAKPLSLINSIQKYNFDNFANAQYSPTTFKAAYPNYDQNSTDVPASFYVSPERFEYNASTTPRTIKLDTAYFDSKGTRYVSSITIPAYQSVLIAADTVSSRPTSNAGVDKTVNLPATSTSLSGLGTDADGTVTYLWSQVSGTTASISNPNSTNTNITGLTTTGVRTFQFAVTDNYGYTTRDTMTVNVVSAPNTPPSANAGMDFVSNNSTITLSGNGSDAESGVTYAWFGGSGAITSPNSATTTVTGLTYGTYTFTLTVTDAGGLTSSDNITVRYNRPPTVNAGNDGIIIRPASTFVLGGNGSDQDGPLTYAWTKLSGGTFTISSTTNPTATLSNLQIGTYVFRLTATDNDGATTTDDVTLVVLPASAGNQATSIQVPGIYKIKEKN